MLLLATALAAVDVHPLARDVWVHTSVKEVPGYGPVVSNGLIVRSRKGIWLVDTAWTAPQTREVLAWVEDHLDARISGAVVTHAHEDKMGGMQSLRDAGIPTWALRETNELAPGRGLLPADHTLHLAPGEHAALPDSPLEVFFPGAGHADDNVVVTVRKSRVLHGGCFIRPGDATGLGFVGDGDADAWGTSLERLLRFHRRPRHVVPSHGAPGGRELLAHTTSLLENR